MGIAAEDIAGFEVIDDTKDINLDEIDLFFTPNWSAGIRNTEDFCVNEPTEVDLTAASRETAAARETAAVNGWKES